MKALLLRAPKDIAVVDLPRCDEPGKVVIRVKTVGVCGSDVTAYKGISPMVTYPRVLGHEIAGEVVSTPANDRGIAVGDRVVTEPYMYCGGCYPCRQGRTNCCEVLRTMGVHADGGMAEYYCHDVQLVHKVPAAISWEEAPLIEPLTIALHGLHRASVAAGETVVIIGAGGIGLLVAAAALHYKARPVLIDPLAERLDLAKKLGVEHVIDPRQEDPAKAIAALTGGRMAEAVIEASGATVAVKSSLDYVAYSGRVALIGWPKEEVPLPTYLITKKEIDVRGSRNSAREFPEAIELIAGGRVRVTPLISHVVAFDDLPACIAGMAAEPAAYLKVVAKL
jgi:2-desacetyl-2-hydroxyethyl bacteriochlorophyllide A dehydrogenase